MLNNFKKYFHQNYNLAWQLKQFFAILKKKSKNLSFLYGLLLIVIFAWQLSKFITSDSKYFIQDFGLILSFMKFNSGVIIDEITLSGLPEFILNKVCTMLSSNIFSDLYSDLFRSQDPIIGIASYGKQLQFASVFILLVSYGFMYFSLKNLPLRNIIVILSMLIFTTDINLIFSITYVNNALYSIFFLSICIFLICKSGVSNLSVNMRLVLCICGGIFLWFTWTISNLFFVTLVVFLLLLLRQYNLSIIDNKKIYKKIYMFCISVFFFLMVLLSGFYYIETNLSLGQSFIPKTSLWFFLIVIFLLNNRLFNVIRVKLKNTNLRLLVCSVIFGMICSWVFYLILPNQNAEKFDLLMYNINKLFFLKKDVEMMPSANSFERNIVFHINYFIMICALIIISIYRIIKFSDLQLKILFVMQISAIISYIGDYSYIDLLVMNYIYAFVIIISLAVLWNHAKFPRRYITISYLLIIISNLFIKNIDIRGNKLLGHSKDDYYLEIHNNLVASNIDYLNIIQNNLLFYQDSLKQTLPGQKFKMADIFVLNNFKKINQNEQMMEITYCSPELIGSYGYFLIDLIQNKYIETNFSYEVYLFSLDIFQNSEYIQSTDLHIDFLYEGEKYEYKGYKILKSVPLTILSGHTISFMVIKKY